MYLTRALYDFVTNRFVVVAVFTDFPNSRTFVGLAASQTNDATFGWNVYRIQVADDGQCLTFPTLGQNSANDPFVGGINIGFNVFNCSPSGYGGFADNNVAFWPKAPIYAGETFAYNVAFNLRAVGGTLVDTIQPVNVSGW